MPSRSRSRDRKRADHQAPSVSRNLKKNDQHSEKPSNMPCRDSNGPGTRTRSRSRGRQNEENLADVAGNAMTGRRSPLIREYIEEGGLQISQLDTMAAPKSEAEGSRKQVQHQTETIHRRTRSQSISIDREASERSKNTGRGRRMERRSTNTSLSPFCEKNRSPKIEMKANMLNEKKFFVVELVDCVKSGSGTESPRSVSLSRSTSAFQPALEGSSITRNARSLSRNRKQSKEAVSPKFSPLLDEEIKSPVVLCRYCDAEFHSRYDLNEHLVNFHKHKYNTAVLPPTPSPTYPSTSEERKSIMKNTEVERKSVSFGCGESDPSDVQSVTNSVFSITSSLEHMKNAKTSIKKAQKMSSAQMPKDDAKLTSHSIPFIDAKSNGGIESKKDSDSTIDKTRKTVICEENSRSGTITEDFEKEKNAESKVKRTRKRSISNSDQENSRNKTSVQEIYPSNDLNSVIVMKTVTETETKSTRERSVSLSGTESDHSDLQDFSTQSKVVVHETVSYRKDNDDCTKRKSATVGCIPIFSESDTSVVIDMPPHSNFPDTNKNETSNQTRVKKKRKKTKSPCTKQKEGSFYGHLRDLKVNSVNNATRGDKTSVILPNVISNMTSVTEQKEVAKSRFNENADDLFKTFNLKKVSVTVEKCDAGRNISKYIPKNYKSVPITERKNELPIERECILDKSATKVSPYIEDLKKPAEMCVNFKAAHEACKEKAQSLSLGKETCEMLKSQTEHENDLDLNVKEQNLLNSDSSDLELIPEKEFVACLYSNKEILDSSIDAVSNFDTNIESQTSVMKGNETNNLDSSYNKDFDIDEDVLKDFMKQEQIRLDVSSEEQGLLKDFVEQEQLYLDDSRDEFDSSLTVDLSSATFSTQLDECYYNKTKLETMIDLVYKKYKSKQVTNLRTYSKNCVEFNVSNEDVLGVESELKANDRNITENKGSLNQIPDQATNKEKNLSQQSREDPYSATPKSKKLNKKTLKNTKSESTKKPASTALDQQSVLSKLPVNDGTDTEGPQLEVSSKSIDTENIETASAESVAMNSVIPRPETKKQKKTCKSENTVTEKLKSTALEQQCVLSKLPVNFGQDTEGTQFEMRTKGVDTENIKTVSVEPDSVESVTSRPEKLYKKTLKSSKTEPTTSKKLESTALEQKSVLTKSPVNVDQDKEVPQFEINSKSLDTECKEITSVESVAVESVIPRPENLNKKTFKNSKSECTAAKTQESTAVEKISVLPKLPVNNGQNTEGPQIVSRQKSIGTENIETVSVESVAMNTVTPETKMHKKKFKNSKSECTAWKKLDSSLSKFPVSVDHYTEVPHLEMSSKHIDANSKEIVSSETVARNVNGLYDNSAEILETIDSVINKIRSESIPHKVVSCDESLEINPCSETEDVCNEKSYKTSPTETKYHHSIKIKLKRKRTWLQSIETPLEECGSLFCDSTQTDDKELLVKHRKKEESKNTKETVETHAFEKSKIPVLKLKKVPFSTFTCHNGLRIKFVGTKLKPNWIIKDKRLKAMDEIHESFKADKNPEHNRQKEFQKHEKGGINTATLKHGIIESKESNFEKLEANNIKSKEVASKTCSDTEILPNLSPIRDYYEVNNNTICSDGESDMSAKTKCLQNVDRVALVQKFVETPEKLRKDGSKIKKKKDHTNSGNERKLRDIPSKTCSDTKSLSKEPTIHDNHEEHSNTLCSDAEGETNSETLKNTDWITLDQKVKETSEKVKKDRLKTKKKKDHKKSERKNSKGLKVKILSKKEKNNQEHQLTEFDRVMLNSGKDRKVNIKLAKRSNSIVRRKSDDSESPLESNRDIIFKKSKKRKPAIENSVSLLSKSKIAQSILNRTEKERKSNEEEIPDFPPITDFESLSLPPLSASKSTTNSDSKSPNKHNKTSDKSSRPLKNLMKTLESVDSVRNMKKSIKLKDFLNGDGLTDLKSPFVSTPSVTFSQSPFFNALRPLESPFGKTDSLKPTNLFKPVPSVGHSEELQGLNKARNSTDKERNIFRNSFSLMPEHSRGESKGSDLNAAPRLKQQNFVNDSAFSSPKSFQSGLLSPVSGAFMSNKLAAKPVLISSTPNINLTSVSPTRRKRSFPFNPDGPAEKQQFLEPVDMLFSDLSRVGPAETPERHESSSGGDGEIQKTFMSDNTDTSFEIISAEASGILPTNTSILSDTQVKDALDWYTNRPKEKEVIKAHKTVTSPPPQENTDIEERRKQKTAPVEIEDRNVTGESHEITANSTSSSKTSLLHVTEKQNESAISVKSQKIKAVSDNATKRSKPKLKRLETNPGKSCGNDLSFQSVSEQSIETIEKIKVTKDQDKSETIEHSTTTDGYVNKLDKNQVETKDHCDDGALKEKRLECNSEKVILSEKSVETNANGLSSKENYDELNKSVSKPNNTKDSEVNSVMETHTAKITCDIETNNSLFMPDYQDTIQLSVDSVNDSFENETPGLTSETLTSMKSFQTIDETGFQTDVTEDLLSPDILRTNPNVQKRTEDTSISGQVPEMLDRDTTVVDAADENAEETIDETTEETAEDTQDESTDVSDSESVLNNKTEEDIEEKDDVLSLLASDEDASFLEDESDDDCLVGMGAEKRVPKPKPPADDDGMGSKSLRSESSESADMDVESPSSPSHTAEAEIEVNRVHQKQMKRDMIPPSYCYYFNTLGNCKRGSSCRFRHDQPTKEVLVKHWKIKMDQYLRQGELDRSLLLFEKVMGADEIVHSELVLRMFVMCQQAGNVRCFCLINYMFKHQFLNVDVINKYIYMCGNKQSSEIVNNYLWEVFQRMVSLNIQPSNDAMYILLRAFTDSQKWDRLWEVMLYCNELENFIMPPFCQEKALRAMLKEPNAYFNYAVQFLLNSEFDRLQSLDKQLLQEVNNLCQKSGQIKLSQGMKKVLSSRSTTPRPRTPVTPFIEGQEEEEEEEYNEDDETVREWMNKFHGLQYSRNWDYLAELYLMRSTIYSPVPDIYINKIVEILKKNEKCVEIFAEFLACTFKRYAIESAENERVKIDDKGLATIGNSLLIHFAENQNWQNAFTILCHMVSTDIEFIKFCGAKREVARVAMETCLQCSQPDAALQVLKETTNTMLEVSLFQFICRLFPNLLQQLLSVMKFHDCVYVLSRAFCAVFKGPTQKDISIVTAVENHTSQLLKECLRQGDVPVGVKIFALWMEYNRPFVIDTLTSRSLLVACYDNHYEEVTHNVFEMMKRANIYPFQRITKPRSVILPMWSSSQEMFLIVSDYLKWLYNTLCDSILENVRLTQADLQLSICFTGQLPPTDEQVPFLHSVAGSLPQLQKMAADVLCQLAPGIGSIIQPNRTILLETASLERWLTETDKKSRRQGFRFSQSIMSRTGITGPARPPRGRGFHRPQRHPIPR